ncbi:MAG: 16S rRNA (guanine(966)-N(2))-methyltransferase RsmD [Rickettsiales bacterium]|nr:16S rRNA (guanine(966)-N(2))-methyltransferase RsmD [Rickettsiales bacterium]
MRIIAGKHKGRRIEAPKGKEVRPTTEKCREALFNLFMHGGFDPSPVIDQPVLDVCCGTGALGLEALSRGAQHVTFVDSNRISIEYATHNAENMHEKPNCRFLCVPFQQLPKADAPVGLVMMDAPYRSGLIKPAFKHMRAQGWLKGGTILAFEQDHKEEFPELADTEIIKQRKYGKTVITILEFLADA